MTETKRKGSRSIDSLEMPTAGVIYRLIGDELAEQVAHQNDWELLVRFLTQLSDIFRCWATYLIGCNKELNLVQMLEAIRPFVANHHFNGAILHRQTTSLKKQ